MKVKIKDHNWNDMLINEDGEYVKPFNIKKAFDIVNRRYIYIVSEKWVDSSHGGGGGFIALKLFDAETDLAIDDKAFKDNYILDVEL